MTLSKFRSHLYVGCLVLDGAVDPTLSSGQISLGQAAGFENALRAYVEDCQRGKNCPLTGDVDDGVKEQFDIIVERIISQYFKQPSYLKIEGEPVFCIYELNTLINGLGGAEKTKEALDYFTQKTREAGFPGLHLQSIL